MGKYTQSRRPMRIYTSLEPDELLLAGFSGHEAVSEPYAFSVELLSENASINAGDLLGSLAYLEIDQPDGTARVVHGRIRRLVQMARREDLVSYYAEIVPWLWFLSLTSDCRIFQEMKPLEIIKEVFSEGGFNDYEDRCTKKGEHLERAYCVQYRETNLDFVSRLMEEEGVFYFFEHTDAKHTLVMADSLSAIKPCPGQTKARVMKSERGQSDDVLASVQWEHALHTGRVTVSDFDFLQPAMQLTSSLAGDQAGESFLYPWKYTTLDAGARLARIQVEANEAEHRILKGEGNVKSMQSGCRFDLTDHYRGDINGPYQLLRVTHEARAGDYRTWDTAPLEYRNTFEAIPADVPYQPQRNTPRPVVEGVQTAIVVGPAGEEIFTDEYGRIKVQFHWDRVGQKNENSSCWVRVATSWAGKQWGVLHIPRIGQEVVVDFLEGDPDRPLVVGAVYNQSHMPPYALPAEKTVSTTRSRSTVGGSGSNFNEIRMEDKKDSEELFIHAEKDLSEVVKHDRTRTVGNDETVTVANNRASKVGADEEVAVGSNQSVTIGKDRTETVGSDESVEVGGERSHTIGKDETLSVGGNRSVTVNGNETTSVGKGLTVTIAANENSNVGKTYTLKAGDEIALSAGGASITMKKDGSITIKGKNISIEGGGKIDMKASGNLSLKGAKVRSN